MTTTSKSLTPADRVTEWLGPKAGPAVYNYLKTQTKKSGALRYLDVDKTIDELIPPRFISPVPNAVGCWFDLKAVDYFIRFCRTLHHVKGTLARNSRRFEPDIWQVIFIIAPLFGWKNAKGLRVFRTLYLEVPKKNGKSTLAAALALFLTHADGEAGAEVVCAAGDKEQARAVYDVASAMVKTSKVLARALRPLKSQIIAESSNSSFKVMSADGDLKAGLNLHGAIIDELLVQKKRTMVDNLEGATAAREQPLVAYLTTGGIDDPGSIYTEKRTYAEKIAKGVLEDPTWLTVIYTIDDGDDWRDSSTWAKANPGLGISVQFDFLKKKAAQAEASPQSQNKFLRDHLNVRTGQVTRWLDIHDWDKSGSTWVYPVLGKLAGKIAYGGLDLASTTDLAAFGFVVPEWMPDPDEPDELIETLNIFLRAWTPEATLEQREIRDQAPYQKWVDEGWLVATPGNVIDYDDIENEIYKVAGMFELRRLHFDRWGSKQLIQHVSDELGYDKVYEMGQGFASMSPALKEFERVILEGRIRHGANPLLRYAVQSLAVKTDPAGNYKPDRERSTGRIDPFVAGTMALDAWARDDLGTSAYETA